MKEKDIKSFFSDHLIDIAIVFICVVYVFAELINIKATGKTVSEILWDGGRAFILSYSLSQIFGIKGIKTAEKSEKAIQTDNLLAEKIIASEPHISVMDEWCEKKTLATLERIRRSILAKSGIRYEDVFDDDGNSKEYVIKDTSKKIRRRKEKALHKALCSNITNLTSTWLMSAEENEDDPYNHNKTKGWYLTKKAITDLITKILVFIAVGSFTVDAFRDFNYAKIIWGAIQVATYLLFAVVSYLKSYDFVMDELRGQKIKRINLLNEFLAQCAELERKAAEKKAKAEAMRKEREIKKLAEIRQANNDFEGVIENVNILQT
jgi:hypothetical protein